MNTSTTSVAQTGCGCRTGRRASFRDGLATLLPATLLVLMPKCPMCLAAYIAMATGLGLSFPTASALRTVFIVLCLLALTFLLGRLGLRFCTSAKKSPEFVPPVISRSSPTCNPLTSHELHDSYSRHYPAPRRLC